MTWQSKTVWTKTFIVFYRDVPTSDGRVISRDTEISRRRLPVPVFCRVPNQQSWHGGFRQIGKVTFLNESDDGCFWADVELDHDPASLPPGLYPEASFGHDHPESGWPHPIEVVTSMGATVPLIEFVSLHLGFKPAWRSLDPVT